MAGKETGSQPDIRTNDFRTDPTWARELGAKLADNSTLNRVLGSIRDAGSKVIHAAADAVTHRTLPPERVSQQSSYLDLPGQRMIPKKLTQEEKSKWEQWASDHSKAIHITEAVIGGAIVTLVTIGAAYHFSHREEKSKDKKDKK